MKLKRYIAPANTFYKNKNKVPTTSVMFLDERYTVKDLSTAPTKDNFTGTDKEEPIVCFEFGCPKHLSDQEKRFGNKCINHQTKKKIDPTQYISHPLKKAV